MKKKVRLWCCGALSLLLAVPAFTYNQKAQQHLEAEINGLLTQGNIAQARQVLKFIPQCPQEGTVYKSEAEVPTRCAGDKGEIVNVKVANAQNPDYTKNQTIPVVFIDELVYSVNKIDFEKASKEYKERKAKLEKAKLERAKTREGAEEELKFASDHHDWYFRKTLNDAERELAYEMFRLLKYEKYEEMEHVWRSIPFCKDIQGRTLHTLPKFCKGGESVAVTATLPTDKRYEKSITISNIRERNFWKTLLWVDLASFNKNKRHPEENPNVEHFKKYKNTWFYPVVERDFFGCWSCWMEWGKAEGISPYEWIWEGDFSVDDGGRAIAIIKMVQTEAEKRGHPEYITEFKQALFFRCLVEGTGNILISDNEEKIWDVLGVDMPEERKKPMREGVVKFYIRVKKNRLIDEYCHRFRSYAQKYDLWSDEAENIYQEIYHPTWIKVKRAVQKEIENLKLK